MKPEGPTEDRVSRTAWAVQSHIDVDLQNLQKRLLEGLLEREREMGRDPSEDRLWREAGEVLQEICRSLGWYSDAGLFPENMARYLSDETAFLGLAREHELSVDLLHDVAESVAALHAEVVKVLRGEPHRFE